MRIMSGLLAIALVAGSPLCAPAATFSGGPAPADEYFGPHQQSILEMRNRLQRFDTKTDAEMLEPGVINELDDIAYSISDWRHQYPNDPWLPHAYAELLTSYHRAGELSSAHAMVAFSEMQNAYPDNQETRDTIAMVYGDAPPQISLFAAVAPVDVPAPAKLAPPPPIVVPAFAVAATPVAPVQAKSNAWARFDAMRSGTSPSGNP